MYIRTGSIYIIRNIFNNKVYIGQTTMAVRDRWMIHLRPATSKLKGKYKIYNAMNKYGKDNFFCNVLESNILISDLNDKEIYYIEKFDSYAHGYNSTKGGDGRIINTEYNIEEIVLKYKSGISATKIAVEYGVNHITIERILHSKDVPMRKDGAKLSLDMLSEIISKAKENTYKEVAHIYGVDERTIWRFLIKHGFRKRKQKK